ncbi:MAG: hypothetical protein R3181_02420 [Rubricoccaceae bacterium]|nr:hypothetical protein [Rubricoccaceae bacterium]
MLRRLPILALTLLAGCSLLASDADRGAVGPVVFSLPVLDLDGDGPAEPQRFLIVQTEASYNCLLPLAADLDVDGSRLLVEIEGIAEVSACATAIGPARADFPLSLADGTYTLTIEHLGRLDRYRIELHDEDLTVTTLEAEVSRYEASEG